MKPRIYNVGERVFFRGQLAKVAGRYRTNHGDYFYDVTFFRGPVRGFSKAFARELCPARISSRFRVLASIDLKTGRNLRLDRGGAWCYDTSDPRLFPSRAAAKRVLDNDIDKTVKKKRAVRVTRYLPDLPRPPATASKKQATARRTSPRASAASAAFLDFLGPGFDLLSLFLKQKGIVLTVEKTPQAPSAPSTKRGRRTVPPAPKSGRRQGSRMPRAHPFPS